MPTSTLATRIDQATPPACPPPHRRGLEAPDACQRCGEPGHALYYDSRRHLCEGCFGDLLASIRNLPPMDPMHLLRLYAVAHAGDAAA
jgi:hypothetical protein